MKECLEGTASGEDVASPLAQVSQAALKGSPAPSAVSPANSPQAATDPVAASQGFSLLLPGILLKCRF